MHMPGHKGAGILGFEGMDLTEIYGADELLDRKSTRLNSSHIL